MVISVAQLYRFPLKSMLGERLDTVEVTSDGLAGDRAFAVTDGTGRIGSVKHPRKWVPLLHCRARTTGPGAATVTLPDGGTYDARDPELADQLSKLLDRRVSVLDTPPDGLVLERAGQGSRPVTAWPVTTSNGTEAWS